VSSSAVLILAPRSSSSSFIGWQACCGRLRRASAIETGLFELLARPRKRFGPSRRCDSRRLPRGNDCATGSRPSPVGPG
jgi:hypothetical protein